MRASVHASTLSNMNIFETSGSIVIKFYLKHHWGGGKAGCRSDQNSGSNGNRVAPVGLKRGKRRRRVFSTVFDLILFIYKDLDEFEIWSDSTTDYGGSCP